MLCSFSLSLQTYEGQFLLRRKSGSCIKQHIKLMPVKNPSGYVSHHVTIRRQLSSQEIRATMYNSGKEREIEDMHYIRVQCRRMREE